MEIGRKVSAPPKSQLNGIALCCIGRRENRYAREFVEHYKSLGFDKVFICDNNRDGEERFEDVLFDFIREGFVEILDYRNRAGVQRESYNDVYRIYGKRYKWIAFFDFDEYLTITSRISIQELVHIYEGFDCVLFNWQNYGDNGLLRDDGRKLSERFTEPLPFDHLAQYSSHRDNDHCKCMLRGGMNDIGFVSTPHLPDSHHLKCCNSLGQSCRQSAFVRYDYSCAYLKHYLTKTIEEWSLNKWQKGTGNKESIEDFKSKYVGRFFAYNEWNQEKEDIMRKLTGLPPRIAPNRKDVVITNYNTQKLTEAAIRSLNKCTPDCFIHVFDNSDSEPFVNEFDNVEVIDNTKGQLIDFEDMLSKYNDKYPCTENNYGSAKHCKTVDYCFDLFPNGFLLMDSDVLVKKDVSPFFDEGVAWSGSIDVLRNRWNCSLPRVLPYLCYLNVKMLNEYGVRYFNGEKMWFLSSVQPNMLYDTGCWFFEECKKLDLPESDISINDYILHLKHGSWCNVDEDEWLEENKGLWE